MFHWKPLRPLCTGLGLLAIAITLQAADLPGASPYRGEIRRDTDGKLIAVPPPPPAAADNASPGKDDATAIATQGKVIRVGPLLAIRTLAEAARIVKDGDTVEIEPGDYVADVAVWPQDRLTLRARQGRVRMIAGGANAEGKAIWVIRGGRVIIENIDFNGAKVRDKNGAGIRLERGHLTVRNCSFIDNENGILVANKNDIELDIENSEFANNGFGDGRSHHLYVGQIRRLKVTGSYFHHAKVGHLLKSRAQENYIAYNRLTDESGGRASYELEFPSGGIAYVIGNIIQQGALTENSTLISFGAEGYRWPHNQLYLINNTLVDDRPGNGVFLRVKPGADLVKAVNNLVVGRSLLEAGVKPTAAEAIFKNNVNVDWAAFVQASRHDYRLAPGAGLQNKISAPGKANDVDLWPSQEYVHPRNLRPLRGPLTFPGALQSP